MSTTRAVSGKGSLKVDAGNIGYYSGLEISQQQRGIFWSRAGVAGVAGVAGQTALTMVFLSQPLQEIS